jgi:Zn-finger nucleic acid-binding protein
MAEMTIEGVDLDFCSGCKGLWFDKDEMAFMTEMTADFPNPQAARTVGKPTLFPCPRCQGKLEEILFAPPNQVLLDRCLSCHGVWLDKGELAKVEEIAAGFDNPRSKILRAAQQLTAKGYSLMGVRATDLPD